MDEKKVMDAAYKARRALIRANMAHLRHNIKQSEAGQLYNEMRKLQHEAMEADCHLRNVATEDIPVTYDVVIGGDNKEAKERVDELAAMLNGPQLTVQFNAEAMIKGLEEAGKRFEKQFEIEAVGADKELVVGKEPELLENPDMSPWASSIE